VQGTDTLYYRTLGQGPDTVVLVHGFGPFPAAQWEPQALALADSSFVLIPDMLFFGQSNGADTALMPSDQADRLLDLLRHVGIKRFRLAGHSYGGLVALTLAERAGPSRVRSLFRLDPLHPFFPRTVLDSVEREAGKPIEESQVTTQFEMHGVESLGLLKMDFLGLRNLDVISDAMALIRLAEPNFDVDAIPLDDAKTFELLSRGDTVGVFQLESPPMQQLLRAMAPTSFEDVSAVIALYRPGPMGVNMHYDFADRKNGRKKVEYFHPDAEEVLGDTFGLMIYQESVMRVAQRFAGYSLAEADNLRKACGKKERALMEKERSKYLVKILPTAKKQIWDIQLENTPSLISVTLFPIVTLVKSVQLLNA
jgi:pimeloyl-ACP methyl ester carboxylesterase